LIAGSNVLHRLLVPRHPPIALSSLSQKQKTKQNRYKEMLASTIQFSKYDQEHRPETTTYRAKHPDQGNKTPNPNTHTSGLMRASPEEKPVQPEHSGRPDSSGPNSAPRSLTLHHFAFHAPEEAVLTP
ncbi:hypothetical protein, partial [Kribbella sandramycini]|uniref:hypothetical protein n=1 Tax=Kribbella sandramycini TaxID=60450 RepID=UPI0031D547FE